MNQTFLLAADPLALQKGVVYSLVGISVVFAVLILLFVVFKYVMPAILEGIKHRERASKGMVTPSAPADGDKQMSGEVNTAIAAAIYHYFEEIHDEENTVLTIHKAKKSYSPWSSKIYNTYTNRLGR